MDWMFSTGAARALPWLVACLIALAAPARPADASAAPPAIGAQPCNPADPGQVRLQIAVSGMRSAAGSVSITIYPDDAKHFLNGHYKLARQALPVVLPVTHACFAFPAPGYYAVALFHDRDNSGSFRTTMLGLPAEGYGFSNNPTLRFGPPTLAQVRVAAHRGDNPITVQMQHFGG